MLASGKKLLVGQHNKAKQFDPAGPDVASLRRCLRRWAAKKEFDRWSSMGIAS